MNPTANASSSSAAGRLETDPGLPPRLTVDLLDRGLLPALPAAYLRGRDLDLLEPLRFLPPGEVPQGEPPKVARGELARGLEIANRAYGHPRAGELAAKLAAPETRVVVAGQQPGLFGGPLYTLSKMVAVSRWAAELEDRGIPAVPVFWVATEDHDFAEVAQATIFASGGLRTFDLGDDPEPLVPVGMRTLGPELERIYVEMAEATHGERYEDWLEVLGRWYRPDARFGEAFCRLMIHFLGNRTPLLLDSMLPEVKAAQSEALRRLVEEREALEAAYAAKDGQIRERGYEHQVSPQRGVSPLFLLHRGQRRRIEWPGGGAGGGYGLRGLDDGSGEIGELLERIDDNPSTVSPGVLARPAVQDAILGTFLQVLGPGEVSYMAQATPTYQALGLPGPWITLRPQALILESHLEDKLEQTGLDLADLLASGEHLETILADRSGGDPVAPAKEEILEILEDLKEPILELDPNLERPWEKTRDQVVKGLDILSGKATSARARQDEIRANRVDQLRETVLPEGRLQERVISSSHYPGKYRQGFAESFFRQLALDPCTLQVIRP